MWYKRTEAQEQFTLCFISTEFAGAFGGLLATAIGKMNNIRGYHAWRWISILEGILTFIIALAAYFFVPDFPENSSWLTGDELALIEARLAAKQDATPNGTSVSSVLAVLKDSKGLLGGLICFALIVPAYGIRISDSIGVLPYAADRLSRLRILCLYRDPNLPLACFSLLSGIVLKSPWQFGPSIWLVLSCTLLVLSSEMEMPLGTR